MAGPEAGGRELCTATSLAVCRHLRLAALLLQGHGQAVGAGLGTRAGGRAPRKGDRGAGPGAGQAQVGKAHLQDAFVLPLPVLEHHVAHQEDVTFLAHAVQAVPIVLQLGLVVRAAGTHHLQPPDRDTGETGAGLGDPRDNAVRS